MLTPWDERFLEVARLAAGWSKDPRARVGAVLVDVQKRIASIGYNGFPSGVEDSVDRLSDKALKNEMVIHAELNAVLDAGSRARDGTLYVVGKPVCSKCAGSIIQRGVRRIIAQQPEDDDTTWNRLGKQALQMLKEAGVEVDFIDPRPRHSRDAS